MRVMQFECPLILLNTNYLKVSKVKSMGICYFVINSGEDRLEK